MRRRAAVNITLGMLVAALALIVLLSPPKETARLSTLGEPGATEPETIRIERRGAAPLAFRRTGADWSLVEPLIAPANPQRVRELLSIAALPVLHAVNAGAGDLARFELDPPLATLRLADNAFSFGAEGPLDGGRYAAHRGRVSLVPDTLYLRITQGPGFFIDPAPIRAGLRPVRIALPDRVIARAGSHWRSESGTPADAAAADALAAAWQAARAIMVRAGVGEYLGSRIVIAFESGAAAEFEYVRVDGNPVLLRRDLGLQYHLDPDQARQLLPGDN
jgi:hypothetical protein